MGGKTRTRRYGRPAGGWIWIQTSRLSGASDWPLMSECPARERGSERVQPGRRLSATKADRAGRAPPSLTPADCFQGDVWYNPGHSTAWVRLAVFPPVHSVLPAHSRPVKESRSVEESRSVGGRARGIPVQIGRHLTRPYLTGPRPAVHAVYRPLSPPVGPHSGAEFRSAAGRVEPRHPADGSVPAPPARCAGGGGRGRPTPCRHAAARHADRSRGAYAARARSVPTGRAAAAAPAAHLPGSRLRRRGRHRAAKLKLYGPLQIGKFLGECMRP